MINAIDYDLVVVGSSAGGIEALSILVATLPSDFPVPMVLAQHLDPNHPSHLHDILQRQTKLKVVAVEGLIKMEAGNIYVVPSNKHVIITDGHVALRENAGMGHSQPSIDLLMSTAAAVYGERLIAVILTGSGSDGSAGALDVKQAGGTVIVQNPRTARYPSMPMALPASSVDFESDIENIGGLLNNILKGAILPPGEGDIAKMDDDEALQHILENIREHSTIDFSAYKKATILRRIGRRMTATRLQTLAQYAEFIATHPSESSQLINAFLINVTRFFRDSEAFVVLKDELLPALIADQRSGERTLRFWSAGCATGEEPYSLAILLTDLLGPELPNWNIKIFATDVDEAAINFARRGLYTENSLVGMRSDYLARFFERSELGYQIDKALRGMVIFGNHDLSQNGPFPKLNMVICRNVLIYFNLELQDQILNAFTFSLYPNGYLFLGKAETVHISVTDYEQINKTWKIYRCIRRERPITSVTRFSNRHRNGLSRLINSKNMGQFSLGDGRSPISDISQLRRFNESLLRFLLIGVVIIDQSYHLLTANLTARRLLGIHELGDGQDFLHAAHGIPYEETRNAIDTAFRDRKAITIAEIELGAQNTNRGNFIALTVTPMHSQVDLSDLAIISVSDISPQVEVRKRLARMQIEHGQLLQERSAANQHLNEVNERLLEVNERLQVSNDDLILSHEELQSTIEEFETTNEELQASNEEMETTNEELQASNEELQATNDEIRVRTLELQNLTNVLIDERARLVEMVELAPFYILVLRGPELRVQAFNPPFGQLMNASQLQGQPLSDVAALFNLTEHSLTELAHQVYQQDVPITTGQLLTHLQTRTHESVERFFVFTLKPSHATTGAVEGVVVYAEDITEYRQRAIDKEQALDLYHVSHQIGLAKVPKDILSALLTSRLLPTISQGAVFTFEKAEPQAQRSYSLLTVLHRDQPLPGFDEKLVMENSPLLSLLSDGDPIFIDDMATDLRTVGRIRPTASMRESSSLAILPLRTGGNYFAVVVLYSTSPWTEATKQYLHVFTEQISVVLQNMLLFRIESTARYEAEQANQLKLQFLAMISHELRTPLASIKGFVTTLLSTDVIWDAEATQGFLAIINEESDKLTELIDQLLDLSRLAAGQLHVWPEKTRLQELLAKTMVELESLTRQHHLVINIPADLPAISIDSQRTAQVLGNLIGNAAKFAPPQTPIIISAFRTDSEVQINVSDSGPGISVEDRTRVFEAFRQIEKTARHTPGAGLGLAICKGLVEAQGGKIWIADAPSPGTTVSFTLPLATG